MGTLLCVDLVERVTEFLDSPPDSPLSRRIREHTAVCWACAHYVGEIGTTISMLSTLPPEPVPESLVTDLLDAYRGRQRRDPEVARL